MHGTGTISIKSAIAKSLLYSGPSHPSSPAVDSRKLIASDGNEGTVGTHIYKFT